MSSSALLTVAGLRKVFARGLLRRSPVVAVDDLSFEIPVGGSLGIVGESGSGKTTVARLVSRLDTPTSGGMVFEGEDLSAISPAAFARHPLRRRIQHVFQDPAESLTPHIRAGAAIADPLRRFEIRTDIAKRVRQLANSVGLQPEWLERFPHQLSGGQQARVGIARALAAAPSLLVLDEPTAALDVSVQAGVLKLLHELRQQSGIALLFISHDIEVVRLMCERIVVMKAGRAVEHGATHAVLDTPQHDYTRALLAARSAALDSPRA
jgi:peptide/nickel transport system ATP-binding protein